MESDGFTKASAAAPPPVGDEALPCPMCGYDLRATISERCSECGWVIDRELLRSSGIPWAHRREIGRIRAYCKTVWLVAIGSRKLRYEAARPQNPGDARRFRWVTAAILAIMLVGAFIAVGLSQNGLRFLSIVMGMETPPGLLAPSAEWLVGDVLLPWSAGAVLWPVLPLCLILLAIYLTGAPRAIFHLGGEPVLTRQRAQCVAMYASAPWALLLPWMAGVILVAVSLGDANDLAWARSVTPLAIGIGLDLLAVLVVISALLRPARMAALAAHGGLCRTLAALIELGFLWLVGLIVLLIVVPWAVGFLWIAADSLR